MAEETDLTPEQAAEEALRMLDQGDPEPFIMRRLGIHSTTLKDLKAAHSLKQRARVREMVRAGASADDVAEELPRVPRARVEQLIADYERERRDEVFFHISGGQTPEKTAELTGFTESEVFALTEEYAEVQRQNALTFVRRGVPAETICAQLNVTPDGLDALLSEARRTPVRRPETAERSE